MKPRSWLCCCAVAAWLLLAASTAVTVAEAYTPTKSPASGQISPAVLIMGEYDWALSTGSDGKPWSRCLDMVWRARKFSNGDRLNIVPTHHWLPNSNGLGVASFCYMHSSGAGDKGTCMAWTAEKLAEFKRSMTYCFTEAFKQGFVPYVRPHLDDGLNRGIWRNSLLFSPTTKYGGMSYADVMLTPLAEAMRDALAAAAKLGKVYAPPQAARPVVYMGLQGEMSATLMRFTSDWASLIPTVKSIIGITYADVKVGVGLNFNALDAVEGVTPNPTTGFLGAIFGGGSTTAVNTPAIQSANVNDLLSNRIDFVGVSAYSPYSGAGFSLNEFQNAAFNVGDALASLANGVSLVSLVQSGKLELHYSEFGIGGGVNGNPQISPNADMCAKQPWAGIAGSYSTSMDPWQQGYLATFRDSFYSKAMDWLSSPGSGTYEVKEVFVWCMASWDVFGIYPDSSSGSGSYRDLNIVKKIAAYNTAVLAAQVCAYEDAKTCSGFVKNNTACLSDTSGTACLVRSTAPPPAVVTESGPAQPGSDSTSPDTSDSSPPSAPSPPAAADQPESGAVDGAYLEMAPDASAASPAPDAAASSPATPASNVVFVTSDNMPAAAPKTKNAAPSRGQVAWVLSVLLPLVCAVVFAA